jgi:hypothetical protein
MYLPIYRNDRHDALHIQVQNLQISLRVASVHGAGYNQRFIQTVAPGL